MSRATFSNETSELRLSVYSQFLSHCSDNYIALGFLQNKRQPIHTNLLNSAGSGRGKGTTTVHLQVTEQQRLEDLVSFISFYVTPVL